MPSPTAGETPKQRERWPDRLQGGAQSRGTESKPFIRGRGGPVLSGRVKGKRKKESMSQVGVRKAEVEDLLRLVGRIQDQPAESAERADQAVAGIGGLIGARAGLLLSFSEPLVSHLSQAAHAGRCVSFSDVPASALRRNICEALPYCPAWERLLERCGQIHNGDTLVLTRCSLVSDVEWYDLELVRKHYVSKGIDRFLCAVRQLERVGRYAMLLVYRSREGGAFKRREQELIELFWSTAAWCAEDGHGANGRSSLAPVHELEEKLSPRLRQVLSLMLKGYQADLIAEELGLSIHTVYEHMRRLYNRAGVSDRRGLISKLNEGRNGGGSARKQRQG